MKFVRDSDTSLAAAVEIESRAATLRAEVFRALQRRPSTDEELQQELGMAGSTERPRRVELMGAGRVRDSGVRRPTRSGKMAVVWKIVEEEEHMAEQPSNSTPTAGPNTNVARPHIVSVESNVKGAPFKYDLAPRTLIIGDSRTGKTGITNAVELALTGRASDVRGREDVAEAGMLMALAPGRAGTLFAEVTLSDGTKARWETSAAGKGSAKAPKHQVPPGLDPEKVLPLRPVKGVIVASPDSARRNLLGWIAGGVTHADVEALIPGPLLSRYKSLLVAAKPSDTAIDRLLHATEQARKEAREAGVRAKTAEKITAAAGTAESPPSDEEIAKAEQAIKDAKARLEVAVREDAKIAATKRVQNSIEGAQQEMGRLDKDIAAFDAQIQTLNIDLTAKMAYRAQIAAKAVPLGPVQQAMLVMLAKQAEGVFGGQCLCCMSEVGLDALKARYAEVNAMAQERLAAMKAVEEVDAAIRAIQGEIGSVEQQKRIREAAKTQLQTSMATFTSMQGTGSGQIAAGRVDVEQAKADEENAQKALQVLLAKKTSWMATKRGIDAAAAEQETQAEWKRLEAACDKAVEMLLDRHVSAVEAKVQARLPKTMEFGLQLRDGARGVFELGFKRDGVLNSAVSGGEWALMTAAMADAFAPAAGLSVVIPFDRQMDPHTLAAALDAWSRCDSQVIVASVVEPARIPDGWKVIRLGSQPVPAKVTDAQVDAALQQVAAGGPKPNPLPDAGVVPPASPAAEPPAPKAEKKPRKPRKKKGESDEDYAKRLAAEMTSVAEASTKSPLVPVQGGFSLGPCPECGVALDRENSSTLGNGRVVHVGCPSKAAVPSGPAVSPEEMAAAILAGPTVTAAGGRIKLYDVVPKAEQGEQEKPTLDSLDTTGIAKADPNLPTV